MFRITYFFFWNSREIIDLPPSDYVCAVGNGTLRPTVIEWNKCNSVDKQECFHVVTHSRHSILLDLSRIDWLTNISRKYFALLFVNADDFSLHRKSVDVYTFSLVETMKSSESSRNVPSASSRKNDVQIFPRTNISIGWDRVSRFPSGNESRLLIKFHFPLPARYGLPQCKRSYICGFNLNSQIRFIKFNSQMHYRVLFDVL